jgi:YHS domain-containing protein
MLRLALLLVLVVVVAHAFWRLVDGVVEGMSGLPSGKGQAPARRISMERDPVCGTFVVPDRAVRLADGPRVVYFCSTRCRDAYRARIA